MLTYKLSQDHLELFFGAVRAACGNNNNPTVRQFIASYKRLLMRHNVEGGIGNCTVQDDTQMLFVARDKIKIDGNEVDSLAMSVARMYGIPSQHPAVADQDFVGAPNYVELSDFKTAVIGYMAGYVVRMVKRSIKCADCAFALTSSDVATQADTGAMFLQFKNRGSLVKASASVVVVCEEAECCFQRVQRVLGNRLPQSKHLMPAITTAVLAEVWDKTFCSLYQHMFDSTADGNHVFALIKCIAHCYCSVHLHHLAKQKTAEVTGANVRKQLTKLVLFKHQ